MVGLVISLSCFLSVLLRLVTGLLDEAWQESRTVKLNTAVMRFQVDKQADVRYCGSNKMCLIVIA